MVFGLVGYVVYRQVFETSLTKRVSVPAKALTKEPPEVEYGSILVPMFGTELDDDIVGTAGRLADAGSCTPGRMAPARPDLCDAPATLPNAPPPKEEMERAEAALHGAGGGGVRVGR